MTKTLLRKIFLLLIVCALALVLTACKQTVPDGSTGVVIHNGIVQDEWLSPGRHPIGDESHTDIVIIDNKIQDRKYEQKIEGQSKDDVIINVSGYGFRYRIGSGEKSVWLVKNVTDYQTIIPPDVVENALKDSLLELEAKNATKRVYVEPIFKEFLQARVDECLGYRNGDDTTIVEVLNVSVGNLSPEKDYDQELSRATTQAKRAENDKLEYEANIANAEAQAELAKYDFQRQTVGWDELSEKFTPEVAAYLIIEKWDGHLSPGSPMEEVIEYYIKEALEDDKDKGENEAG